jgi:hypothetical protein
LFAIATAEVNEARLGISVFLMETGATVQYFGNEGFLQCLVKTWKKRICNANVVIANCEQRRQTKAKGTNIHYHMYEYFLTSIYTIAKFMTR